jgi:hypothetical protein
MRFFVTALILIFATTQAASAAETGIAYDAVMVAGMGVARSEPGYFDADFQAAQAPLDMPVPGGDMAQVVGRAQEMMSRLAQIGMASRFYAAGARSRIDNLSLGTSTIVDCATRIVTQLNYKTKTYATTSLDDPAHPWPPAPAIPISSMKVDVEVVGPKIVQSVLTDAYAMNATGTLTPPGFGPMTISYVMTWYFTKQTVSLPHCQSGSPSTVALGVGAGLGPGSEIFSMLGAAQSANAYPNVEVTGVPLPAGRIPLFMTVAQSTTGGTLPQMHDFGAAMECGHVRPISSDDPIFSIPADFTKAG